MMKDNKLQLLVLQTDNGILEAIQRRRNPSAGNNVCYETNPDSALQKVSSEPIDIVITGERFYDKAVSFFSDDRYMTGTELSEVIHDLKPEVLVFRYSSLHGQGHSRFAGDIDMSKTAMKHATDFSQ